MSEMVTMSRREFEDASNGAYHDGRIAVLENLSRELTKQAGEAFAIGDDQMAHWLRELARKVAKRASEEREQRVRDREVTHADD